MEKDFSDEVLRLHGFQNIGHFAWRFPIKLWWDPERFMRVTVISVGDYRLLKTSKDYQLVGVTPEGETRSRDLNLMQDYLESVCPELHIRYSYYRDITTSMILREIGSSGPSLKEKETALEKIKDSLERAKSDLYDTQEYMSLAGDDPSLASYLKNEHRRKESEIKNLMAEGRKLEEDVSITRRLLKEYEKKGRSVAMIYSYCSNIQMADNETDCHSALASIEKEVTDASHFLVKQALQGGRFQIYVEEVKDPELAISMWEDGVWNPRQLEALGDKFSGLQKEFEKYLIVTASQDIQPGGPEKKRLAERQAQNFIHRLKKHLLVDEEEVEIPMEGGGLLGMVMRGDKITDTPFFFPLKRNLYISGTNRMGKSYAGRIFAENALAYDDVPAIVCLDPTLQFAGMAKPKEQSSLDRFEKCGLKPELAKGFNNVRVYTPGLPGVGLDMTQMNHAIENIPEEGCSIFSFKDMPDREKCEIGIEILQSVYRNMNRETGKIELVLIIEEGHAFTPQFVVEDAKKAATEFQKLLSRVSRETPKFGCVLAVVTQLLSDFQLAGRSIREMVHTRLFFKCTDVNELKYVKGYLGDDGVERVKSLQEGEAIIITPQVQGVKLFMRPPFTSVREPSFDEIRAINRKHRPARHDEPELTEMEARALKLIRNSREPMLSKDLDKRLGITGGTRHRLLEGMIGKGLIQKVTIRGETGRPKQGLVAIT